jgi:D-alanyl-D-alanine carboxypeptidase
MTRSESLARAPRAKLRAPASGLQKIYACSLLITVLFAPAAFPQSAPALVNNDLAASMDKVAGEVYKPGAPGAAVIAVKDGRVVFRKGYGVANMELNVPIGPEMVFRLASITKQFTAAAVMMLVEQRKLSLQDDITKFFPDYPTGGKRITVENLLTHTSGIRDYLEKLWPQRMREDFRPERLIDLFKNDGLEFEPGTRDSYSNSNYVLLGVIIEKLSGKEYGRFIEENIFKPLGMKHSYYERVQEIIPDRVYGYARAGGGFVDAAYVSMPQLYAAGGLCSSVDDLALWDAASYSDKLLKRTSWERLFTPYKLANGEASAYASGWAISQFEGQTIASHTGGIPGFTTYVLRMPRDHVYVAILSNDRTAEVQPEYVAKRLAAIAIGKPITEPKIIKLDTRLLDEYVGQYQEGAGDVTTVRREGDRLFAQSAGDPEVELFPTSEETFLVKAYDARISFVKGSQGDVTGMTVSVGGRDISLRKIK